MGTKLKLITLMGFVLLFASLTGLSCSKKTDTTATSTPTATETTASNLASPNLVDSDATSLEAVATQNYELAKNKATSWKPDAVLVTEQVKLPTDLGLNKANETYIFGSASDTANWWSFSVSESTSKFIRALIPKEDYLGTNINPINAKYMKMNYAKAFQAADKATGSTFRSQNPDSQVTLTLHTATPNNWLWWDVEYKSASNKLVLKVNPNDGNVVDEQGNPVSTGTTTGGAANGTNTTTSQ